MLPPNVPRGVAERAAAADKRLDEIAQETPAAAIEVPVAPAPPVPPVSTPSELAPAASGPTPPAPAPGPKPGETAEATIARLTQALKVLQGKYNAEVPALMRENAQLKNRIGDPIGRPEVVVEDRHRQRADAWGIEPEEIAGLEQDIVDRIQGKKEAPDSHERTTYLETLDALVGGSAERAIIVNDPTFGQFLDMIDAGTQRKIMDLAVEADTANDSTTMAEVYRAFYAWKQTPAAKESTSNLMPASSRGGQDDLRTNKKPIYTQGQIDEFRHRVQRGEFRTIGKSPEDKKKVLAEFEFLSNEFDQARLDGRIRG